MPQKVANLPASGDLQSTQPRSQLNTPASIVVGNTTIEQRDLTLMAGPCAVENREWLFEMAPLLKRCGVKVLRGGAFKPRTFPSSFQGLGEQGLMYLREAADAFGLAVVSEVMDARDIELVSSYVDILQIGSRNMQNFTLLREAGRSGMPVLLKRGMSATFQEFVGAAGYILAEGNNRIIFCERGIRTFSDTSRFTLDLAVIPRLKALGAGLVFVDPSHSAGEAAIVPHHARAAVAAGADGLLIEVHPHPEHALCDGAQALLPSDFAALSAQLSQLRGALSPQ